MYSEKNLIYVLTALEAIEKIFIYTKGFTNGEELLHANDQMNFNACQTLFLAIGEETKKIEKALKEPYSQVPWKQVAGFRNRLAHDYRGIDPDVTFDIVVNYLPDLKQALVAMLQQIDYDPQALENFVSSEYYKHLKYLLSP